MKVLIVGGGIAGLALAHALQKKGVQYSIIEKNSANSERGYWIYMYDNGAKVLSDLGLHEAYMNHVVPTEEYTIVNRHQKHLHTLAFTRSVGVYDLPGCIDRPRIISVLSQGIPVKYNTTFTEMTPHKSGVSVTFSDGTTDEYDLVVGADGIHSRVREVIMPNSKPRPYGLHVWLYPLTSKDIAVPKNIRHALGNGSYMVQYPNGKDRCGIYVAIKMPRDARPAKTDLKNLFNDTFAHFEPELKESVVKIAASQEVYDTDLLKIEVKQWHKGRVVLIGDAQHAMSQLIGQGASLALEDAVVLAEELTKEGVSIDEALSTFATRRQKRVWSMQKLSNRLMMLLLARGTLLSPLRNLFVRILPRNFILNMVERELKKSV